MLVRVRKLQRGDVVIARTLIDPDGAHVRPGTMGVVFEKAGACGDGLGPIVRWMNMGVCNICDADIE